MSRSQRERESQIRRESAYTSALARYFDKEAEEDNICDWIEQFREYSLVKENEFRTKNTSIGYTFNVVTLEKPQDFVKLCSLVSEYKKINGLKTTDKVPFITDCFDKIGDLWPSKQFPKSLITHLNGLSPNPRPRNDGTGRGKKHRSKKQQKNKTRRRF